MKIKRILSVIIILVLTVCIFAVPSKAASTSYKDGYYTYDFLYNGNVYILSCDTSISGDIVIPSYLDGHLVEAIAYRAFRNCTLITSVVIPDHIYSIGNEAFKNCSGLTSIDIPDNITFGQDVFYKTGYYNNAKNWNNNVLYLDNYCLGAKTSLSGDCVIKEGITTIVDSAFEDCKITSILIPNGVTEICYGAFENCTSLISVSLPDTVSKIGQSAFKDCSSLEDISLPNSLVVIDTRVFSGCTSLASITIPNSVKQTEVYAFENCISLKKVNVNDMAAWCNINFAYSHSISNPLYYGASLYLNDELVTDLKIPESIKEIRSNTFANCNSIISVTVPEGVNKICASAFSNCPSLEIVKLPKTVIMLQSYAFENCSKLKTINTDDITDLANEVFLGCVSLKNISLNKIETVGYGAFDGCTSLTTVSICNAKIIDSFAFKNCSSLKTILMYNVESIKDSAFYNCDSLTSIMLSKSISQLYTTNPFYSCDSLTDVYYFGNAEDKSTISGIKHLENLKWHYNFQIGDTNCDGKINSLDLSKLKTGLFLGNDASCDTNRDGIINIIDLIKIKKYLAGYEITF